MTTAKLNLRRAGIGEAPFVEIDGVRLDKMTTGITVRMAAGDIPTIDLDLVLTSIGATVEGDLTVNATPVTDEIGQQIYQALRARYEGRA
jgi:hypothetical protein